MPKQLFLSVIIPAYNEEKRLSQTLEEIVNFLSRQNYLSEIIVVDDGSTDNTAALTQNWFKNKQRYQPTINYRLLRHRRNLGKGAAIRTGMSTARGFYALFTDADGSTPIQEVVKLLDAIKTCDLAIGSRHLPGSNIKIHQPWYRRFLSRSANRFIQQFLLPGIKDTQCGFKLFKTEVAHKIFPLSTISGWGLDMEILFIARKLGYSTREIPVTWLDSPHSRVRPIKGALKTLKELWQIRMNDWRGKYQVDLTPN